MKHYVYVHVDPRTGVVRYVGKGTAGRAWACGWSSSQSDEGRRGNRTEEHQSWISDLLSKGYTPGDWVKIVEQNMTNEAAKKLERKMLSEATRPELLFNLLDTSHRCTAMSKEQFDEAVQLREKGMSYQSVADEVGTTAMSVYRALNGQTKGYQKWLTH